MSYYVHIIMWGDNDLTLGSLKDILGVCEKIARVVAS